MRGMRRNGALGAFAVLFGLLALGGAATVEAEDPVDVRGVWRLEGRFGSTEFVFAKDGTCRRTVVAQGERTEVRGRYVVEKGVLATKTEDGKTRRYDAHASARSLRLSDDLGSMVLDRVGDAPETVGAVDLPVGEVDERLNDPLKPKARVTPSPSGHILYARWEPGKQGLPPRRTIRLMNGDGQGATPFIVPPAPWDAFEPTWSADGSKVAFASNFELMRSACNADIFLVDLASEDVQRVTGNERIVPSKETSSVVVGLTGDIRKATAAGRIYLNRQGRAREPHGPVPPTGVVRLSGLPASTKIWIKARASTHVGGLLVVETPAAGQTKHATLDLTSGMPSATCPSLTPDGKHVVVLWQHAYFDPNPRRKIRYDGQGKPLPGLEKFPHETGIDTVAVVSIAKGTPPLAGWDPIRMGGEFAKHPSVSPDGARVAFTMGTLPRESIAVCSLASLVAGNPVPQKVVEGRLAEGLISVGNAFPAWSPDGRFVVFCQARSNTSLDFQADLCIVGADGRGARRITQVGPNQAAVNPTWSPDGRRIAFQLITSRRGVLNPLDIAGGNVVSDIYSVATDGSDPRQLTHDGLSAEPAWGR